VVSWLIPPARAATYLTGLLLVWESMSWASTAILVVVLQRASLPRPGLVPHHCLNNASHCPGQLPMPRLVSWSTLD